MSQGRSTGGGGRGQNLGLGEQVEEAHSAGEQDGRPREGPGLLGFLFLLLMGKLIVEINVYIR